MVVDFQGKHNQKSCWSKYIHINCTLHYLYLYNVYNRSNVWFCKNTQQAKHQVNILVENPKSSVMMPSNVVNYPRYTIPSGKGSHDWMKSPPNFQIRTIHLHFYPFYPFVIFPERMFFFFLNLFFLKTRIPSQRNPSNHHPVLKIMHFFFCLRVLFWMNDQPTYP